MSFTTIASSTAQKRVIPSISIGEGYVLNPVKDEQHMKAFETIVNDESVYRMIRHGERWPTELVCATYNDYIKGNIRYIQQGYTGAADFLVTWLLENAEGQVIGRASFQMEDGWPPVMTNIAIAIKKEYHGQFLGKRTCKAMVDWFDHTIQQPLRWLSADNNQASIKIALSLGFLPILGVDGTQASVTHWGKKYLVFERENSPCHSS
jgi:RimJ/RimL family protein N-acetyltransferase